MVRATEGSAIQQHQPAAWDIRGHYVATVVGKNRCTYIELRLTHRIANGRRVVILNCHGFAVEGNHAVRINARRRGSASCNDVEGLPICAYRGSAGNGNVRRRTLTIT